ncbi:phosphatidylglycerophosphatase A family protein [Seleniivibrio woodruffii]|uniref:Phosphatidylglycerophosphatase A n=1 Tax=Seleniivibrio woodruffii TaxID=1078050 RepID=A0A4R1KB74_9BACT|nr:phosphatidylglycerophosphatase A [Seleniivibrio woodruffii]TCK61684.1 phosphatidylglycerophosphatase A [Seleniivibrio woodruffii]TVZ35201.1 phosphatidylglycerophosphatase A [Seleniivibrio woodruffii]
MDRFAKFLALGFGSGLAPKAPGTFGTLAGVVIVVLTSQLPYFFNAALFVLLLVSGVWAADRYEKLTGKKDASEVVIDEIAAYFMIYLFIPANLITVIIGFVLFRIFDIAKPYPIKKLEKIDGGLGVMADDIMAGLYSTVILGILYLAYASFFSHI